MKFYSFFSLFLVIILFFSCKTKVSTECFTSSKTNFMFLDATDSSNLLDINDPNFMVNGINYVSLYVNNTNYTYINSTVINSTPSQFSYLSTNLSDKISSTESLTMNINTFRNGYQSYNYIIEASVANVINNMGCKGSKLNNLKINYQNLTPSLILDSVTVYKIYL